MFFCQISNIKINFNKIILYICQNKTLAMNTFRKLLFVLTFFSVSFTVFSDDSLQSLYRKQQKAITGTDTAKMVESYKNLGDYLSESGDLTKANEYLLQGLVLAQKAKMTKETGTIYLILAANSSYQGNRPQAFIYYHKALKSFADLKQLDDVALVMMNLGSEYEYAGNLRMAIAYKLKALKNKEASGVKANLDYYYQSIGQLFKETNVNKWKFYAEKAYQISKSLPNSRIQTKAAIFNDLGGIAKLTGDTIASFAWYDSMLVICKKANYQNGISVAFTNRSLLYLSKKEYNKALSDVLEALKISEKAGGNYTKITNNIHAANILIRLKRTEEAKKRATIALSLAKKLKYYPEEEATAYLSLAQIGELTGNWKLAFENHVAYINGIDSIRNADVQKNMHDLETKYQTAEKEKKIALLDNENKLKNISLQRSRIQMYALIISILLISFAILFLYLRNRLKEQKQKAELKQRLLRSQMNPHFMFNTLNAINQYIQTNKGNEASDYLAKYSKLMRQILENSDVEFVTLETEIEFLSNYMLMQQLRFNSSFSYQIIAPKGIDFNNIEIPPMIAQPFIENAIEHGIRGMQNGEITIKFNLDTNKLNLLVADNGKGLQATSEHKSENHKSFAISITKERLIMFGNKPDALQIFSPNPETGIGTLVSIDVPFKNY